MGMSEILVFTVKELEVAVRTMKDKIALGTDGIPSEVLKAVFRQKPELLLKTCNGCLTWAVFCNLQSLEDNAHGDN